MLSTFGPSAGCDTLFSNFVDMYLSFHRILHVQSTMSKGRLGYIAVSDGNSYKELKIVSRAVKMLLQRS